VIIQNKSFSPLDGTDFAHFQSIIFEAISTIGFWLRIASDYRGT
jgi:hypothetical protein